jgi:hypothetical protein
MLGGMLAGHEESGGTVVEENGEKFMLFYGMSSESAMTRHVGGVAKYRAAEGKTVKLPLRGPVENTARDILGGLRSACTYVGASRLKELTNVRRLFAFRNRKTAYSIACNGFAGACPCASTVVLSRAHRIPRWKIGRYIATTSVPIMTPSQSEALAPEAARLSAVERSVPCDGGQGLPA